MIEEIAEEIQELVTLSRIDRAFTARHFHQHKYCWPVPVLRCLLVSFRKWAKTEKFETRFENARQELHEFLITFSS